MRKTNHLKQIQRAFAVGLSLICLVLNVLPMPVAANTESGQLMLTINQVLVSDESTSPSNETFTYQLIPQTDAAPLPSGSDSESFIFTIAGTGEVQIGSIQFNTPGIYIYELSSITDESPNFTIDRQVYTIEVHVTEDLTILVVIHTQEGAKAPEITFEHIYKTPSDEQTAPDKIPQPGRPDRPEIPKTGDSSTLALIAGSSTLLLFILLFGWKLRRNNV